MSDTDSPLSSPPESEDELPSLPTPKGLIEKSPSPPPKKPRKSRAPPHTPTFADLPEIAFIVAFQSRFNALFKGVPNLGPQDIETGVINIAPSEPVEQLLCRLVSLVLNRKKNVEKGHHSKALEEAIHAHQPQWAPEWEGKNPLSNGKKFNDLDAKQRLVMLRYLILWALTSSDGVRAILADSYKTSRRNDDLNVPLSIQPWGKDAEKRNYYLIEGRDDTAFRLYRESNTALKTVTWQSLAGTIDELKAVATELAEEGSKAARELQGKILAAIPRFEEGENKRKRREYRVHRKQYFKETGSLFSYEGRTRGKRIKYTFSDDDEGANTAENSELDSASLRRSGRSRIPSPTAPEGPRFTASGRQIRRPGGTNDNTGQATPASVGSENGDGARGIRKSARNPNYRMMLDDGDTHSTGADDDHDDYKAEDTEDDRDDGMSVDSSEPGTLEVVLKYNKAGPVSNYLTTSKNKTENLTTNPAKEVDTVMKDIESEAPANENGQNTPQNGTDVQPDSIPIAAKVNGLNRETKSGYLQQLPVGTGAPPNGTTVAEIRSKGPEVG